MDAGVLPRVEESGIGDEARLRLRAHGAEPRQSSLRRPVPQSCATPMLSVRDSRTSYDLAEQMRRRSPISCRRRIPREMVSKGMNGAGLGSLLLDQMEELFTAQDPDAVDQVPDGVVRRRSGRLRFRSRRQSEAIICIIATRIREMLRILRRSGGTYPLGVRSNRSAPPRYDCSAGPMRRLAASTKLLLAGSYTTPARNRGSLPLLAFVLSQLFEKRSDRDLSEAVYDDAGWRNWAP